MGTHEMADLRKIFENRAKDVMGKDSPRNYVVAAITIDGHVVGRHEFNEGSGGPHAEEAVVNQYWDIALARMRDLVAKRRNQTRHGDTYRPPRMVFAISASPCKERCSPLLKAKAAEITSDPILGGRAATFVLAPRAAYEGRMDPKKKTLGRDLDQLVVSGWDLRQLATKIELEPQWERPLAELAHKIHAKVNAAG